MHSVFFLSSILATAAAASPPAELFSPIVPQKVLATFKALPNPIKYPQYTTTGGIWQYFSPNTWTSGFFPVTGYALNTRKSLCGATSANNLGIADWLALGRAASNGLIPLEISNGVGHDVGFLSFPFVEELVVNPNNQTAKTAVNAFAKLLAGRFNPVVGATRSWGDNPDVDFQVIIDNMMNLEVLFHSSALTGNKTLENIAIAHADTTIKNHIRADGSTWHVVEYNATSGAVIRKRTAQGFSDSSTWSRGQAWGIYGFANMYRFTGNMNYLVTARRLAKYFLDNLPSDGIVPWDYNAPLIPAPRPADSSAATIAATGLLMLSKYETTSAASKTYSDAAINLLNSITKLSWNRPGWQSILSNGTVNKPANNQLTGTAYGDYYFIKAGNDLISQNLATCL
ncbi:glycoside hydrolase family 88 protein [Collybia nuda]|uniref:Glycoside hydrolase family 88 protein n=1 Tax=Collybia nuda TaxID=64659 RepID=A0A9P5YAB2_9AGAR|nr:glycoside hydrolase family 88 protein [Collybia nuda]